jgi:hypothetical protein
MYFGVEGLPWWAILLIVVVILAIVMIIPSGFVFKRRRKKANADETKTIELKTDVVTNGTTVVNRASEFEAAKPQQTKEKLLLGMFNGVGHKTAIRMKSLVYVYPEHDSCELCRPFEGQVLSLEKYDNEIVTMSEAISKGYHHIGCKHVDLDYYPNETEIPVSPWNAKEQTAFHKKVLELFKLEAKLRKLMMTVENGESKTPEIDTMKINDWKGEIQKFCEKNNLTYTDRRINPNQADLGKFTYLAIESEEN